MRRACRRPRNRLEGNTQGLDLREASAQSFGVRTVSTSGQLQSGKVFACHQGPWRTKFHSKDPNPQQVKALLLARRPNTVLA